MKIQLEPNTFRIPVTKKWETCEDKEWRESPTRDIWVHKNGEQLYTWNAAMRETKKAGKRLPTYAELEEMELKDFAGLPAGYRYTDGAFSYRGFTYLWSSSEQGSDAWICLLYCCYSTIELSANPKTYGFSVRCVLEAQKTEQCFCKSYMNDDGLLVDCTCEKCEIAGKYPKEEVQDCFACPHCKEPIYYNLKK